MHSCGSTSMIPKGGCSSSGTQYMQSPTGQYPTQTGEPAHPVQFSLMTARILGFFFRGVEIPSDFGSLFTPMGCSAVAIVTLSHHRKEKLKRLWNPPLEGRKLSPAKTRHS